VAQWQKTTSATTAAGATPHHPHARGRKQGQNRHQSGGITDREPVRRVHQRGRHELEQQQRQRQLPQEHPAEQPPAEHRDVSRGDPGDDHAERGRGGHRRHGRLHHERKARRRRHPIHREENGDHRKRREHDRQQGTATAGPNVGRPDAAAGVAAEHGRDGQHAQREQGHQPDRRQPVVGVQGGDRQPPGGRGERQQQQLVQRRANVRRRPVRRDPAERAAQPHGDDPHRGHQQDNGPGVDPLVGVVQREVAGHDVGVRRVAPEHGPSPGDHRDGDQRRRRQRHRPEVGVGPPSGGAIPVNPQEHVPASARMEA
jgi:hypothetical protein